VPSEKEKADSKPLRGSVRYCETWLRPRDWPENNHNPPENKMEARPKRAEKYLLTKKTKKLASNLENQKRTHPTDAGGKEAEARARSSRNRQRAMAQD